MEIFGKNDIRRQLATRESDQRIERNSRTPELAETRKKLVSLVLEHPEPDLLELPEYKMLMGKSHVFKIEDRIFYIYSVHRWGRMDILCCTRSKK